ncbi:MAG: hypothetical protein FWG70_08395 [Oscillospiraceae bacterium]|nr:hypothetical protein [Oscillospiraceae bacterium]
MQEITPRKLMTPTLVALLIILMAGIGVLFYVYIIVVPDLPAFNENGEEVEILAQEDNISGENTYFHDYENYENYENYDNLYEDINLIGDGSIDEPFIINTINDLEELAVAVRNGSSFDGMCFRLMSDIDMSEYLSEGNPGFNNGEGWLMIGTYTGTPFNGIFDGNGHTISGLWVNRPNEATVGLFGQIRGGAVFNLNVEATSLNGRIYAGALAGGVRNCVILNNSATVGEMQTKDNNYPSGLGGLIGDLRNSYVEKCYAFLDIEFYTDRITNVGGLIGMASVKSTIKNSHATVNIVAKGDDTILVGGLVGYIFDDGLIDGCYSEGSIAAMGEDAFAGGVAGGIEGTIINSYSSCSVNGTSKAGGLIGAIGSQDKDSSIINCYATGDVSITKINADSDSLMAGGLGGTQLGGIITNSYATGNVFVVADYAEIQAGGLVGLMNSASSITHCYAEGNVYVTMSSDTASGFIIAGGLIGAQVQDLDIFIQECYSIGNVFSSDKNNKMCEKYLSFGFIEEYEELKAENCCLYGLCELSLNGGFIGYANGTIERSYFNIETSGLEEGIGIFDEDDFVGDVVGKKSNEMQKQETFEGWDFINIWYMPEGGGYPKLRVFMS